MQPQPPTSGDHRVESASAELGHDRSAFDGVGWLLVQRDWGRRDEPCESLEPKPPALWRRAWSAVTAAAARVSRQLTRPWRAARSLLGISSAGRSETAQSSAPPPSARRC